MEWNLLMWGLFAFTLVPGSMSELCGSDPPEISHASFRAFAYKEGTRVHCECRKGFRRIKAYTFCTRNSSWENKCQCRSSNSRKAGKQVTPQPAEQEERKTTEMQSQTQPEHWANLPGHCGEPPPWEHEDTKRIYHFMLGQTIHYQCIQGYKALQKGPFISICKMVCGKARWTQPQLTCINESQYHLFPGEQAHESIDDLPESETSCPITTTGFKQHSEAVTTMESFIFTMEYQVAVAGCVFLLISVLLLSGLLWQRLRWKKNRSTL